MNRFLHIAARIASRRLAGTESNGEGVEEIPKMISNPFPSSKVSYPVYHGSRSKGVKKFRRPDNGLWFAGTEGWVDDLYLGKENQGEVRTCWIDVRNPYTPTEDE